VANRADQRKFHYIYKITRTDGSGKYYIGMHSTDDLEDGYFGSGRLIARSVRKHGRDKHSKEILEFLPSRTALKLREKQLINEEILDDPLCMNLQLGGEGGGGFWSQEQQLKCSSAGGKARSSWTNEDRLRQAEAARKAQRIAQAASNGPEAMEKRKRTYAELQHQSGEKNSQYGTCWVTNKEGSVKIKRDLLDRYLSEGFVRGRKFSTVV
jgi:hypothetical protein